MSETPALRAGMGWCTPTSDAGWVAVAPHGDAAQPMPDTVSRSMSHADRQAQAEAEALAAEIRGRAEAAAFVERVGGQPGPTVAEVLARGGRPVTPLPLLPYSEARRHAEAGDDGYGWIFGDPEPSAARRSVGPDPQVRQWEAQRADPFMREVIRRYDERVARQAAAELRRLRIDAEDRVAALGGAE